MWLLLCNVSDHLVYLIISLIQFLALYFIVTLIHLVLSCFTNGRVMNVHLWNLLCINQMCSYFCSKSSTLIILVTSFFFNSNIFMAAFIMPWLKYYNSLLVGYLDSIIPFCIYSISFEHYRPTTNTFITTLYNYIA